MPERLQEAVAHVLNSEKSKQVFPKKSLGTKVVKEANVAATHVLADFNRTLASAEALLKKRPVISSLTDAQIKRMPSTCTFNSLDGSDMPARTYWVQIDGEHTMAWAARQPNAATLLRRVEL